MLRSKGFEVLKTELVTVNKKGSNLSSTHVYITTETDQITEITIRGMDEVGKKRTCDTFGDQIKGLNIQELERVLKENPAQRFLPA